MAHISPLQESKDFGETDEFDCKLDFIRNLPSPIKSPQRRRQVTNLYNSAPISPSSLKRLEDTSFRCPKSSSPNSDKMCDGVGTLSTASSDGVESSRHVSSISGCNTPLLSHTGEEDQMHYVEEDLEPDSPLSPGSGVDSPRMQEFRSKFQQRRHRCARVVSALAQSSDYKLYGYRSLRAAFEKMDRDGDGRLTIDELKTLLETLGFSEKTAVQLHESLKGIHGDSIDYTQFLATYAPATGGGGCHGRMWPRNYRMLRRVPSVEGSRWCMY